MRLRLIHPFLIVLLMLSGITTLDAQVRNRVDHRGKSFRVAFLHTDGYYADSPEFLLSVSCEVATSGTIRYEHTGETATIAIPAGNRAVLVNLQEELLTLPDPARSSITRFTATLEFNEEVTLYGINTLIHSSDAFLGLPEEVLGTAYTVLSYPNSVYRDVVGTVYDFAQFPSQLAVIGTEDGTLVRIEPPSDIALNERTQRGPFEITLDAGEIFLGQARPRGGALPLGWDLTGTRITSSAPIVVYGSHQRTNIPFTESVGRDHLVEQLPPTDKWATRAIVTPHYQLPKTIADANIVRVIAARSGTVLSIDSTEFATLTAGRPLEIRLDRPKLLTATGPILVAQYQHSTVESYYHTVRNDSIGDPFMMLAVAREQFDSAYAFTSFSDSVFLHHYINLVVPSERTDVIELDGIDLDPSLFREIPKTPYSFAQVSVASGSHVVRGTVPFGLYVYGYGHYNSYGYPGSMVFDSLFSDHEEPEVTWRDTCDAVVGEAFDSRELDFGMEDLVLIPEKSSNVRLEVDPFRPGDDTIRFRLVLIDPFHDGVGYVHAIDTAGLRRPYRIPVKGFTVEVAGTAVPPLLLDTLASLNGRQFCQSITLTNYGNFPQTIDEASIRQMIPGMSVATPLPIEIAPNNSASIEVCYQREGDTSATVEVWIANGCRDRLVAVLPVVSGVDSLAPDVSSQTDDCSGMVTITANELGAMNAGIREVRIHRQENAEINISPRSRKKNTTRTITITRDDLWQDVVYDIEIVDEVGNSMRLADTLGGLTLSVENRLGTEQYALRFETPYDYGPLTYSESTCDTLWLENYGLLTLNLERLRLSGNATFSIPPIQQPISLRPGERIPVVTCVEPSFAGEHLDTLVVEFFCDRLMEVTSLRSLASPLTGSAADVCGTPLSFNIHGATRETFLMPPSPNPASGGKVLLRVGMSEADDVTIHLFDRNGLRAARVLEHHPLPAGIIEVEADFAGLSSGEYFLVMRTRSGKRSLQKLMLVQ